MFTEGPSWLQNSENRGQMDAMPPAASLSGYLDDLDAEQPVYEPMQLVLHPEWRVTLDPLAHTAS